MKFRAVSLQISVSDGESKQERIARVDRILSRIGQADLIVLPEIWATGYFNFERYHQESEDLSGPTVALAAAHARRLGAYILAGSFVEKADDGYYNTSVLLDRKGEVIETYRKIHLFGYQSEEPRVLKRGDRVVVARTDIGNLGIATCYDLRFPELFRMMVDRGAEVFLIASAWPYPRVEHWIELNRVRAFENQCYLVSANCVGVSKGKQYAGHSYIVDPWGVILAGSGDFEAVLFAELDLGYLQQARTTFPVLQDRVFKSGVWE
jgi:predicted amidohydrolase